MSAEIHLSGPIDLAHEGAFRLGGLEVRPATLEVLADNRREVLEPRVMQVLVALAGHRGEVVSRDDLIHSCWGGRIVGEDAINRCISRLRRLGRINGAFDVETVPRVGYRLAELAGPSGRSRPWRLWAGIAAATVALVLAITGAWIWRHSLAITAAPDPRIAVRAFEVIGDDAAARAFAAALTDDVSGVLGEKAVGLAIQGTAAGEGSADMVLHGTVAREGGAWRVRAYLEDRASRLTLWSEQFERPQAEAAAFRDEVATALTDVAFNAISPVEQKGLKLDPQTLALFIAASRAISAQRPVDGDRAGQLLEQLTARAPEFAGGHSALALYLANDTRFAPPAERAALEKRARSEAARAIRIDPHSAGGAFDALYFLERLNGSGDLAAAEDLLHKGLAAAPEHPWLHMRECRFLIEVGRAAEAVRFCERARALRPLNGPIDAAYADALHAAGHFDSAAQAAEASVRIHPTHLQSLRVRYEIAAYHGDPERARALLEDFRNPPVSLTDDTFRWADLFFKARKSAAASDTDRAVTAAWAAARSGQLDPRSFVFAAANLGRIDDAFRALDVFGAEPPRGLVGFNAHILLERPAEALWRDPRFWPIAAKVGYVRYWRTRGKWPDFCSDPALAIDCRREAAQYAS